MRGVALLKRYDTISHSEMMMIRARSGDMDMHSSSDSGTACVIMNAQCNQK